MPQKRFICTGTPARLKRFLEPVTVAQHFTHFQKRLVCISGAILLAVSASTAHADVFGGTSDDKSVKELTDRLSALEAKLATLQVQPQASASTAEKAPNAAGGTPVAPPDIKRAQDLDILAEPPYVVLGQLNGQHLVRMGNKRLLLTSAELKEFEAQELVKARMRLERGGSGAGESLSKLPDPPPPPVAANVAKDNRAIQQAESTAKPAPNKAAKYAAKPANNGETVKK